MVDMYNKRTRRNICNPDDGQYQGGEKAGSFAPLGPTSTEVKVSIRRVSMKLTVLNRNRPFQWTRQTLHTNQLNPLSIFEKIYI